MSKAEQWDVLERKCHSIVERGMAPLIVTQFAFDADIVFPLVNIYQTSLYGVEKSVRADSSDSPDGIPFNR